MEVDRSSSQSALSERPGRWNGRVERGAESARKRDCSHGDCPPTLVGLRGGRLSLTADLSYEPPSPRDARPAHLGPRQPQRTPPHTPHAASGWSGIASESPRPARVFRERSRSEGTFLVSRHADACTAVQKLSSRWNGWPALPPLTPGGQAGGRSMTCLVARHARHADLSEPPLVDVCRWDHSRM